MIITSLWSRRLRWLAPLPALLLAGCQSMAYYAQATQGQATLLVKRQPVTRLLRRDDTPPELRQRLETVQRIRVFAEHELGLPARKQYASYVELGREYPLWAVMATPELSLTPKTWCYWMVGCLSYRGYFREDMARRYAGRLEREGYEVYLSGVPAYSTLGWFHDPLLSSFIRLPEAELAELLFHELTHQVLFVPGDTVFNESLAVAVAEEGLRRYSERYGLDLSRLERSHRQQEEFVALLLRHRERLQEVFDGPGSAAEKRAAKAATYAALRADYAQLKQRWGGYAGYDPWIADLNNARLNTVATYYDLVPALRSLLRAQGGDMAKFLTACRELAKLDLATRHRRLEMLVARTASSTSAL